MGFRRSRSAADMAVFSLYIGSLSRPHESFPNAMSTAALLQLFELKGAPSVEPYHRRPAYSSPPLPFPGLLPQDHVVHFRMSEVKLDAAARVYVFGADREKGVHRGVPATPANDESHPGEVLTKLGLTRKCCRNHFKSGLLTQHSILNAR